MASDKLKQMQKVARQVEALSESPLYAFRQENEYKAVVGEGSLDAAVMFIGEAPGENEAEMGRPFVGASGRVLSEMLEQIGLERDDVYITNVVKDRPPNNRDPSPEEIALYTPFLLQQIEIIQPKVIATLGRFAMDFILLQFNIPLGGGKISELHGKPIAAQTEFGDVTVIPLYHPAVALYNRNQRKTLEEDFQVLRRHI